MWRHYDKFYGAGYTVRDCMVAIIRAWWMISVFSVRDINDIIFEGYIYDVAVFIQVRVMQYSLMLGQNHLCGYHPVYYTILANLGQIVCVQIPVYVIKYSLMLGQDHLIIYMDISECMIMYNARNAGHCWAKLICMYIIGYIIQYS